MIFQQEYSKKSELFRQVVLKTSRHTETWYYQFRSTVTDLSKLYVEHPFSKVGIYFNNILSKYFSNSFNCFLHDLLIVKLHNHNLECLHQNKFILTSVDK